MHRLAIVAVAACAYTPGSYYASPNRFPGQRATIGCLDIAVDRRADLKEAAILQDAAVLDISFGNRCDHAVPIDLYAVPVVGRTEDGEDVELAAHDPRSEIIPLQLDARKTGSEPLAYLMQKPLVQVCIDVGALGGGAAHWLCFASPEPAPEPVERDPTSAGSDPMPEEEVSL